MLETFKQLAQEQVETLTKRIENNKALIEKRSRKTLDIIAADEKLRQGYERDLEALNSLTKGK